MARKRYDSVAFTEGVRRERRRGLLLGFVGAGIIVSLVSLYSLSVEDSHIPDVPADPTPVPMPRAVQAEPPPAPSPEPQPAPPKPRSAVVDVTFTRPTALWLDDESLGKVTSHRAELRPGKHEVRAKIANKTITQRFHVSAGERYEIALDKKNKLVVRGLATARQ